MTEIPEHLLERSRARRAALGLGGGAAPAAAEAGAAPVAAERAAAPARAAAAPVEAVKKPEVVLSPYAQAAVARKKIPFWAVPVLLFLPLWAFLYWGTLDAPHKKATGILAEGQTIYAKCAACHGATGGGSGSIPGLAGGSVKQTFPDWQQQVWWVTNGSNAVAKGSPYGAPDRPGGQRVSQGGMPAWGKALTAKELLSVVYYERVHFGDQPEAELADLKAAAASTQLPANLPEGSSLEDIEALLAQLAPAGAAAG